MIKQITIRSISIEGFKSYSLPVTFKFSNTGLHLIKGLNGSGKTTLFSALTWTLYKVNLNNTSNTKLPTQKWLRSKEYRGTRVQVIFGVGKYKYLIVRHIDFKGLTKGIDGNDNLLIFKKEKIDKTPFTAVDIINDALYKSDAQIYLNKLLGIDSKTFLNSVLFGQRMARLMDAKDADKRDLFERLFDVDFIDALKDKATLQQSHLQAELLELDKQHSILTNKQEVLTQQLNNAKSILLEFQSQRTLRLKQLKADHTTATEQLEQAENDLAIEEKKQKKVAKINPTDRLREAADAAQSEYYTLKDELAQLSNAIAARKEEIATRDKYDASYQLQLKSVKDTCPTCGSKLDEKQVSKAKKVIQDQIIENKAKRASIADAVANLETNYAVKNKAFKAATIESNTVQELYDEAKRNTPVVSNNVAELKQAVITLEYHIDNITSNYKAEKARTAPTTNTALLEAQLDNINLELPIIAKSIRIKNNHSKRLAWWQTKAFNAGGLKTYIFSASLNNLNKCIGAYTSYFGISVVFGIDLSKSSKPFYCKVTLDGEHETDYDSLSGGQKQKVDLCMAFGLQDASEVKTSFNISILDEPEGNLDAEVLETLDMLLRIRSERKAVYVISHNSGMDLSGATVYEVTGGINTPSSIQ